LPEIRQPLHVFGRCSHGPRGNDRLETMHAKFTLQTMIDFVQDELANSRPHDDDALGPGEISHQ
jgi:hypothetical protein